MKINIPDQTISEFVIGVIAILAIVAVGALLLFILQRSATRFPFFRMVLVVALAPLSLMGALDSQAGFALLIFSILATLLGITIEGISYLSRPKEESVIIGSSPQKNKEDTPSSPDSIVWEKAE